MTKDQAIKEALEALYEQRDETYEGAEYDEPEVQAFVQRKEEAIAILKTL